MNASAFPLTGAQAVGAMARGRDKAGARLIFQRCDGKSAGETVILSRARRRLSAIVKQHADRSRPHIVCVYRKGEPWAPTDFSVRARKRWRHTRIGPNDTVAIIYAPRGGGGSGSRGGKAAGIGLLVATIALAAQGDPKRQRDHRVNFGVVTTTPRRMRAEGVSDAAHAIHIATWAASTAYRRRERRTVRMEWAGKLIKPNDKCLIDAWYFDGAETVGVFSRTDNNLNLDQPITLQPGSFGMLRGRDGREFGPIGLTQVDDDTIAMNAVDLAAAQAQTGLTIDQVLSTATQAPTSLVIGDLTTVSDSWLVRSIRFNGENEVEIEAVYDAPGVWNDLGEAIIGPPPPPSSGLVNQAAIDIAYLSASAAQSGTQMYMNWSAGRPRAPVNYVIRISYDDWETYEDAYHGPQSSGTYPVRDTLDPIKVRAFAYAADGQRSAVRETQFSAPSAVVSGKTSIMRVDYDELVAGIRYRSQQLPTIDPLFSTVLEGMVDGYNANRLAETGLRRTEEVRTELTQALVATSYEIRSEFQQGFATVYEQTAALAAADQTFAGQLSQFNARLGDNEAALDTEIFVRTNQASALSQQITSLTATFTGHAAATNLSLQALATADQAIAQQVSQVSARLGNLMAEGLVQFAAVAKPAGVFARFAVLLRAEAGGAAYETGLYLELIQQGSTFYSQLFVDTNRFIIGNPLTRTIPFSVVDGVTYIDEVVIRSGTISRHASTDSGTRSAVISLPVRVGSRVNIIGVYQGGHSGVNGAPSNMHIQRNGGTIKSVPVSFVTYIVNNGASLAYYNCTIAMASYDVGYNGTDTIHVYTDQAFVLDGVLDLNGVSVQAVCFNK